jgi:hypothetical protein
VGLNENDFFFKSKKEAWGRLMRCSRAQWRSYNEGRVKKKKKKTLKKKTSQPMKNAEKPTPHQAVQQGGVASGVCVQLCSSVSSDFSPSSSQQLILFIFILFYGFQRRSLMVL